MPDNPQEFNFLNNEETLGGQPWGSEWSSTSPFGNLQSSPNNPGDSPGICNQGPLHNLRLVPTPPGMTDTQFIRALIAESESYQNDLPYNPFPYPGSGTYNSNSYTSGVIQAAGGTPPAMPGNLPGYNVPLPLW